MASKSFDSTKLDKAIYGKGLHKLQAFTNSQRQKVHLHFNDTNSDEKFRKLKKFFLKLRQRLNAST